MKGVSCVDQLSFVQNVINVPVAAPDLPVGNKMHHFWETWSALEASPEVVRILRKGYTLLFQIRLNLTRSPTIINGNVHPRRNSYLQEALYAFMPKNAVEMVKTHSQIFSWYQYPTTGRYLSWASVL